MPILKGEIVLSSNLMMVQVVDPYKRLRKTSWFMMQIGEDFDVPLSFQIFLGEIAAIFAMAMQVINFSTTIAILGSTRSNKIVVCEVFDFIIDNKLIFITLWVYYHHCGVFSF